MLDALDGFLFVLSSTGRILYVSHTIAPLLGHLQTSLIGKSLFDLVHESDRGLLDVTLNSHFNSEMLDSSSSTGGKPKVSFSVRMMRGGTNTYEYVHCSGNVRKWEDAIKNPSQDAGVSEIANLSQGLLENEEKPTHCLVAVGKMETPKIIRDISSLDLGKNEYLSRHNLEAKYLYVDNNYSKVLEYLHQRALEYGPALPPIALEGKTPHEVLIGSLTGKLMEQSGESSSLGRITELSPGGGGGSKEEPNSPANSIGMY
eukprot:sb/3468486/